MKRWSPFLIDLNGFLGVMARIQPRTLWFCKVNLSADASNTTVRVYENAALSLLLLSQQLWSKGSKRVWAKAEKKGASSVKLPLPASFMCLYTSSEPAEEYGMSSWATKSICQWTEEESHATITEFWFNEGSLWRINSFLDFSWLAFDFLILKPSPRILH